MPIRSLLLIHQEFNVWVLSWIACAETRTYIKPWFLSGYCRGGEPSTTDIHTPLIMSRQQLHLLGEPVSSARYIELDPTLDLDELKHLVSGEFAIVEPKGVYLLAFPIGFPFPRENIADSSNRNWFSNGRYYSFRSFRRYRSEWPRVYHNRRPRRTRSPGSKGPALRGQLPRSLSRSPWKPPTSLRAIWSRH